MELHDWALSILAIKVAQPTPDLLTLLSMSSSSKQPLWQTIVIPLLGQVVHQLSSSSSNGNGNNDNVSPSWSFAQGTFELCPNSEGRQESVDNANKNPDHVMCVALIGLYWHALECLLRYEHQQQQQKEQQRQELDVVPFVTAPSFHRALLSCCYVALLKAFGETRRLVLTERHRELDIFGAIVAMNSTPYTYLKISESFVRAIRIVQATAKNNDKSPKILNSLPVILQRYIGHCKVLVLDSLIWSRDDAMGTEGCVIDVIEDIMATKSEDGTTSSWPPEVLLPTLDEERLDAEQQ